MHLSLRTSSEEETIGLGAALAHALAPGDVLALHGELGAGKTRLVRGIAQGLGADPARVSSPTFVLMQEYRCAGAHGIGTLVHVDAYRLRGTDELGSIGWERLELDLREKRGVVAVVEWAEYIAGALPREGTPARLDVILEHDSPTARRVTIAGADAWQTRPGWAHVAARAASARAGKRRATTCPITGKPVAADSPTYPFFDERARLADLNRWLSGSYRIGGKGRTTGGDTPGIEGDA